MDLIDQIEDLKNFGIDLKLTSSDAEDFYLSAMYHYFYDKGDYDVIQDSAKAMTLGFNGEDLIILQIEDSILRFYPVGEDPFMVIPDVLTFVAQEHKKVLATFEYLEENGGSYFDLPTQIQEDEEDSSDDLEWI